MSTYTAGLEPKRKLRTVSHDNMASCPAQQQSHVTFPPSSAATTQRGVPRRTSVSYISRPPDPPIAPQTAPHGGAQTPGGGDLPTTTLNATTCHNYAHLREDRYLPCSPSHGALPPTLSPSPSSRSLYQSPVPLRISPSTVGGAYIEVNVCATPALPVL